MRKFLPRSGFVLWVSFISFALPEVFAGSGQGWLTRFDVYILALPLYGLHFLLLAHIAIRTKRTSWPALYLFGVIFGLYETWITKVVWAGYPGSEGFAMGGFGSWFGIHETLALVLFYHPVTSFLLPLAVISKLSPAFGKHFPVPDWVFGLGPWALVRRLVLLFVWGLMSGHNMPEIAGYLQSWVPMIIVIILGYYVLLPHLSTPAGAAIFGKTGFGIICVWLALIYLVTYQGVLPERLPPVHIQIITALFYPAIFLLIWRAPKRISALSAPLKTPIARVPLRWLIAVFLVGLAGMISGLAGTLFGVLPFLVMVVLGVGLFGWLVVWRILIWRV